MSRSIARYKKDATALQEETPTQRAQREVRQRLALAEQKGVRDWLKLTAHQKYYLYVRYLCHNDVEACKVLNEAAADLGVGDQKFTHQWLTGQKTKDPRFRRMINERPLWGHTLEQCFVDWQAAKAIFRLSVEAHRKQKVRPIDEYRRRMDQQLIRLSTVGQDKILQKAMIAIYNHTEVTTVFHPTDRTRTIQQIIDQPLTQ